MNFTYPDLLDLLVDTVRQDDPLHHCSFVVRANRVVNLAETVKLSLTMGALVDTASEGVAAAAGEVPTQVRELATRTTAMRCLTRTVMFTTFWR